MSLTSIVNSPQVDLIPATRCGKEFQMGLGLGRLVSWCSEGLGSEPTQKSKYGSAGMECVWGRGAGDRQVLEAGGPVSLAQSISFRFHENQTLIQKLKAEGDEGKTPDIDF